MILCGNELKEQVFMKYPEMTYPKTKRGSPRKHPDLSASLVNVQTIAKNLNILWKRIILTEGATDLIFVEGKIIPCYSRRKAENRHYI